MKWLFFTILMLSYVASIAFVYKQLYLRPERVAKPLALGFILFFLSLAVFTVNSL